MRTSSQTSRAFRAASLSVRRRPSHSSTSFSSPEESNICSMVIAPASPLTAGTYKVDWRAVSSDTHPITGSMTFKVK
ncbi:MULTISPECIES: copper resistance protein CopC [unclassified Pseudomonas]|uniref:copper resistance protein CopC n=1 Tax=Pseudomonas TaxID=286 RepID=UPI0021148CF3|nr:MULTISPECIES: copper resistance protein CopC [unclassified Pseudomonas]